MAVLGFDDEGEEENYIRRAIVHDEIRNDETGVLRLSCAFMDVACHAKAWRTCRTASLCRVITIHGVGWGGVGWVGCHPTDDDVGVT